MNEPQSQPEPKLNGVDSTPKEETAPQPAPRRLNQQTPPELVAKPATAKPANPPNGLPPQSQAKVTSTNSLEGDDNQVLPRPITNEEFQAMIPAHFLHKSSPSPEPPVQQAVTVTICKPDPIDLPPAPTGPGRVTETITKSTFTETVVTRITDNQLVEPLIIEV